MIGMVTALNEWLAQFGTWYSDGDVPDEAELPYGVVPLKDPEWSQKTSFYLKWYEHTHDTAKVVEKADQITAAIGTGVIISYDGGYLVIWPETPLVQILNEETDVCGAYINLSINSYHMPGV